MSAPDLMEQSVSEGEGNRRPVNLFHCLSDSIHSCKMVLKYVDSKTGWQGRNTGLSCWPKYLDSTLEGEKGKFSLNHMQKQPVLEGKKIKKERLPKNNSYYEKCAF